MIENKIKCTPGRLIMVTEEMLSDEVLRKATAEQAIAINDNMSSTNECQHELSIEFEKRIQSPTT